MNELELVMNELELGSGSLELGTGSLELGSFTPLILYIICNEAMNKVIFKYFHENQFFFLKKNNNNSTENTFEVEINNFFLIQLINLSFILNLKSI
jgi:hypothetical protein